MDKIYLYIYKISIHNKFYIGSTYDYLQYKIKIINRIKKTKKYSKIAEYIDKNNIEDNDIKIDIISKSQLQNKNKESKKNITTEFIDLYDSINSGFNKPSKSILTYSRNYSKIYYDKHKSKILKTKNTDYNKIKSKEYYKIHRDKILERNKTKVQCRCGAWVCRVQMRRHVLTKKHEFLMTKLK